MSHPAQGVIWRHLTSEAMAEVQPRRRLHDEPDLSIKDQTAVKTVRSEKDVFVKLLAAGFYGISSFLIVVVNKSVLTTYR